jgi:predicted nucleotidyltransferase
MKFNNPPFEVAIPVFQEFSELQAVYLFGSHATGKTHPESDIDFGFMADTDISDELGFQLVKAGFSNFDLIYIPKATLLLQFEIVRKNKIIYARSDYDRGYYFSKIVRMYKDFQPYRDFQRKCLKERILNGKP